MLASLDQIQRFDGKDIARDDEENGHCEVSTREEMSDERQSCEVMATLIAKGVLKDGVAVDVV